MEMEGARIITLVDGPEDSGGAVSFEEAFGEQSELRGRGRARRQARRMDRINKRKERKSAKQQARQERKRTRVEGRMNRKAMKGQAQRDEAMADAENEQAVEALQPQEEETNYAPQQEAGYSQQEDSGYEEAPEELDQNSDYEEEESEFEAGSTSEYTSSFDAESSDASGKPERTLAQRIHWNKQMLKVLNAKLAELKNSLKVGRLPSNQVAITAKRIKNVENRINEATARLNHLMTQSSGFNGRRRGPMTNVKRSLNARIEPNRIEVPANSSADGDDFSGFDAKEVIKKNKNVLIGVGVAAAVIVGLHFAGVFKK